MTVIWFVAFVSGLLALGAVAGIRYAERAEQSDPDITRFLLSIPADAWEDK